MNVTNDKRREIAAKVRETMGALGQVELDGIPLADLIEPEDCDGCEPGAWEVVAMEVAERLGVAVGGCLPSDYADAIGEALDRRLMPEGYEWPRFEDGGQVRIGDEFAERIYGNPCKVGHFAINKYAFLIFDEEDVNDCEAIDHGNHKRVRRPAPPDSWERLEDDATKPPYAYCVEHGLDDDSLPTNEKFARDLVRRAKDLAGVSE